MGSLVQHVPYVIHFSGFFVIGRGLYSCGFGTLHPKFDARFDERETFGGALFIAVLVTSERRLGLSWLSHAA